MVKQNKADKADSTAAERVVAAAPVTAGANVGGTAQGGETGTAGTSVEEQAAADQQRQADQTKAAPSRGARTAGKSSSKAKGSEPETTEVDETTGLSVAVNDPLTAGRDGFALDRLQDPDKLDPASLTGGTFVDYSGVEGDGKIWTETDIPGVVLRGHEALAWRGVRDGATYDSLNMQTDEWSTKAKIDKAAAKGGRSVVEDKDTKILRFGPPVPAS